MTVPVQPLNETHDPARLSWVASANHPDTDFPIQNLPFGRFKTPGDTRWRVGVAIGDQVLDLAEVTAAPDDIHTLMAAGPAAAHALRATLCAGLTQGAREQAHWQAHLTPQDRVTLGLPCEPRDYTDFYAGLHHAQNVGALFRPDQPLLPNYRWVPIGYHGRASTLLPSGQPVVRPHGQIKAPDAPRPHLAPTDKLDFELELGLIIGTPNPLGEPIALDHAEAHLFGITLLNDWSARDIQAWEYQPLGPFLAKNFATTLSPWIITLDALAPYRTALVRPPQDPPSLDYLESPANRASGAFDIHLAVSLQTAAMRAQGMNHARITQAHFAQAAYWTPAQLITHHTINGCALSVGDVLGTGTLSGPAPNEAGSLLELTQGGKTRLQLAHGEARRFLENGDSVRLEAWCQKLGLRRIGFGPCEGVVCAATPLKSAP